MTLDVTVDLAGLTVDGALGQGLGYIGWRRPAVTEVVGDELHWELFSNHQRFAEALTGRVDLLTVPDAKAMRGLLGHFTRVGPSTVASFARDFGVLAPSATPGLHDSAGAEPLELWWALKDDLATLVRWAAKGDDASVPGPFRLVEVVTQRAGLDRVERHGNGVTVTGGGGPVVPWVGLRLRNETPGVERALSVRGGEVMAPGDLGVGRMAAGLYVDALLGRRRPMLAYDGARGVTTHLPGVTAALALQLGLLLDRRSDGAVLSPALAMCSGCGGAYTAARKPRTDQRRWCPACHADGAPARDRQRRHRVRA